MNRIVVFTLFNAFVQIGFCLAINAQDVSQTIPLPIDSSTGAVTYKGIDKGNGSGSELTSDALWWWGTNHADDDEYIRLQDAKGGHMIARGFIRLKDIAPADNRDCYIWFTLFISCTMDKYKYNFTDFAVYQTVGDSYGWHTISYLSALEIDHPRLYQGTLKNLNARMKEIINSLHTAMNHAENWQ